jgi:hypothetical protein
VAACGAAMGIRPWPKETEEQAQLTLRFWQTGNKRLVVLDNAEDEGLVQEWLPKLGKASVLVTARRGEWAEDLGIEARALDTLARKESRALLRKLAKRLRRRRKRKWMGWRNGWGTCRWRWTWQADI